MSRKAVESVLGVFVISILAIILVYQTEFVIGNYSMTWMKRTFRTIFLPSMERNALIIYGNKGTQFLKFISESVPLNEPIVLTNGYDVFSEQNFIQFFLLPRPIVSCSCPSFLKDENITEACKSCLQDPAHSIPAIGAFPPGELVGSQKTFLRFPGSDWYRGIYVPSSTTAGSAASISRLQSPITTAIVIDFILITLIFLVGMSVSFSIDSTLQWHELLILGIPFGVGSITWPLFLLSWIGVPITLLLGMMVMTTIIVGSAAYRNRSNQKIFPLFARTKFVQLRSTILQRPVLMILSGVLIFLLFCSMIVALGNGYSLFDGIANWALKGYAIAETGSVTAGSNWGGHVLSYPQNIHLMISLFRLADGDALPGSKLMYPLFTFSVLIACYTFWVKQGVNKELAMLGTTIIFTTPIVFIHTTIGWGNLIFSSYLVLGIIYTIDAIRKHKVNGYWIAGLLVAFATWSRPEGIGYAAAVAVILIILMILTKIPLRVTYAWFIPIIVIAISWLLFSLSWMSDDEIGQVTTSYISQILAGNFRPDMLSYLANYSIKQFTTIVTWGYIAIIVPLLLVGILLRRRSAFKHPLGFLFGTAIVFLLIPQFMFYTAGFSKADFTTFLDASFDRAQFHGIILLFVALLLAFASNKEALSSQERIGSQKWIGIIMNNKR